MQHAAWVIPPLVLAAVLGLSAVTKWGKGESLHAIIRNLRLPAWVLPTRLAPAIPAVEVALAVGLLTPWRPVLLIASVGTTGLMLVYWALIARGLSLTPRPTCGCFGRVGDHRISARTLVRNTLLVAAAVAALSLALSGRTTWSLLAAASTSDVLWLVLGILACVVTGLVLAGTSGSTSEDAYPVMGLPSPPVDAPADDEDDYVRAPIPSSLLHHPDTGPVTLLELTTRRAQLLVFVNCYCYSTWEAADAIDGWQDRLGVVDVHLVFAVPLPATSSRPVPAGTLVDHAGLTSAALSITDSPSAVLLGADGYLAGGPVSGMVDVEEFVHDIEDELREASTEPVDTSPPSAAEEPRLTVDR